MSQPGSFPVDLVPLLRPLPGDSPAGEWLRYEGTYDRIQEARREDDETLPQGVWTARPRRANWAEVARLAEDALQKRSKDLQLAAWLTEAWMSLHGLPGLSAGLRLIAGLCADAALWPHLHPLIDGDDATFRLSPIEWIDQKLIVKIRQLPLTQPTAGATPYALSDWEQAVGHGQADAAAQSLARSAMQTPSAVLLRTMAELDEVTAAAVEVGRAVDAQVGTPSAMLGQVKGAVEKMRALLAQHAPSEGSAEAAGAAPAETVEPGAGPEGAVDPSASAARPVEPAAGGGSGRGIHSRAQAYAVLGEVAEFLSRTEPHSPTPYLLKRAISWGQMPLTDLLIELVNDRNDLAAIYKLLGMKTGRIEE